MTTQLQRKIRAALPDEGAVHETLHGLSVEVWQEVVEALKLRLPEFDIVIGVGNGSLAFATALADLRAAAVTSARGTPTLAPHYRSDHWVVEQKPLLGRRTALIATLEFAQGHAELELSTLARQAGLEVAGIAAGIEFTSKGGRSRVDMLGVKVFTLLQLAHTPSGLQSERRGEGGEILMPLT
ncbi:hypothetical protein [Deinococcus yavapaiensis]|uniref:Adenine/guanine phosphoribosyltransferase-like PRPP-binding protein n=1 Tax=Deinococcus yavapaiensis KR-236 TaxID=694435 RepID=A0A318SCP2_9DEIO|nr:hypothetical protein [Deinococcus yavapaiensis]PYE54578.1 adenine/guanine phosphoribosyltransferase-like PRPP-binding protein [Deinococcus yavapaiensis KR-236]